MNIHDPSGVGSFNNRELDNQEFGDEVQLVWADTLGFPGLITVAVVVALLGIADWAKIVVGLLG